MCLEEEVELAFCSCWCKAEKCLMKIVYIVAVNHRNQHKKKERNREIKTIEG
jgi:hypothetical protein